MARNPRLCDFIGRGCRLVSHHRARQPVAKSRVRINSQAHRPPIKPASGNVYEIDVFLLFLVFPIDVMANDEIKSVEFSAQLPFDRVNDYVSQFQKAVKDRSCFRISALTDYPLTINHAGGSKQIWNRTALCRYCPALFNPARSAAVLNQNVLKIPVGSHGLMFGSGLFWIRPVCENDDENDVGDEELRCLTNKQGIVLKLQVANLSESVP